MLSRASRPLSSQLHYVARSRIHNSASVLAKGRSKSKTVVEDDAFEGSFDIGDMFGSRVMSKNTTPPPPQLDKGTTPITKTAAEEFKEQYVFISDRLGPKPTYNTPQIRANALRRILRYYEKDPARLEKFAELAAKWRSSGRLIDRETTLEFIDRCILYHPTLLVWIFADRTKYGMDIPDIKEARRILRALVIQGKSQSKPEDALQNAVSFSAFYPLYGLPSASTDLTSCTLLAQACSQVLLRKPSTETAAPGVEGEAPSEQKPNSAPLVSVIPNLLRTLRSPENRPSQNSSESKDDTSLHASVRESGRTQSPLQEQVWIAAGLREIHRGLLRIGYSNKSAQESRSTLDVIKEELDTRLLPARA